MALLLPGRMMMDSCSSCSIGRAFLLAAGASSDAPLSTKQDLPHIKPGTSTLAAAAGAAGFRSNTDGDSRTAVLTKAPTLAPTPTRTLTSSTVAAPKTAKVVVAPGIRVPRTIEEVDNGHTVGFGADLADDHPVSAGRADFSAGLVFVQPAAAAAAAHSAAAAAAAAEAPEVAPALAVSEATAEVTAAAAAPLHTCLGCQFCVGALNTLACLEFRAPCHNSSSSCSSNAITCSACQSSSRLHQQKQWSATATAAVAAATATAAAAKQK